MSRSQQREQRQSILVGLAATIVVLVAYAVGGLDWLELKTLDLRFLYANSMPESHELVCIDIDDASIGRVDRWPWPRDVQAGILDVLCEVGPRALLIDITLGEAEPVRTIVPRQADIAFDPLQLAREPAILAFPDLAIRAALRDVGQAYLAFDYAAGTVWKDLLESDEFGHAVVALEKGDATGAQRIVDHLRRRPGRAGEPPWNPWLWARLVAAFEAEPTLDDRAGPARFSDAKPAEFEQVASACREAAFRRRIQIWLDGDAGRWSAPAFELFNQLDAQLIDHAPRYREALARALREVLGYAATLRNPVATLDAVEKIAPQVESIAPVYYLQARAARRCGFVVFDPDRDGVMRRTRLVVQHRGHVVPQLAFAVALDQLGCTPADIAARPRRLQLKTHGQMGELSIQLDDDSRVLVPWLPQRDWSRQFGEHVPVDAAWQVFDRRGSIAANQAHVLTLLAELAQRGGFAGHDEYREDLATRLKLESDLRAARYDDNLASAREKADLLREADKLLADDETAVRSDLAREIAGLAAVPNEQRTANQIADLDALREIARALAADTEFQTNIDATLSWLRKRVAGKIGLLGYTATSLADMTPIPTHKRAPGVMAHANLLNGLLTGHLVTSAPRALNLALAAALGLLATLASARWGPRTAGLVGLLITAYIGLAGGLAFYVWTYWIALTPVIAAAALSYFAVVIHRYLFLERERRQLTTALSQYTSPTLARKMAEDAELCRRAETREVTAVFTDLAGFTSISERIGAERTQRVLNVSLGRFSDAILRHEGMINKFIGDGIFAFWNPVIYPQADHALRACETALDLHTALNDLIAEQRAGHGDEAFGELVLRVGAATGHAVVGPCGSEQKYDYTCIGDSVNVASRLESANKFFGTRILISGATHDGANGRFVVRPLGSVQVKGKTQGVPVFELLGRRGAVAPALIEYAEAFAAVLAAFRDRHWTRAATLLEDCQKLRPDDQAAEQYAAVVRHFTSSPPGDDWSGALELTEK